MSLLNIVIHMLFASIGLLSVEREVEDKITIWYQQEKSFDEYRNKFHVTYGLCLTYIVTAPCGHHLRRNTIRICKQSFWSAGGINGHLFFASCMTT